MVKRVLALLILILFCLSLSACSPKEETDNRIDYGTSTKFSQTEIKAAADAALAAFGDKDFKGCTLIRLWYDEARSDKEIQIYMAGGRGSVNGVDPENAIILFSDFSTDSTVAHSFNPNDTYTDWMWILIRDSKTDKWKVDDWGY